MFFAARPEIAGALLAEQPRALREFFLEQNKLPSRASAWFSHFSMEGIEKFKHGSAALARFALAHRSKMWHLLRWKGKHAQAPVAVASKPHYFCELDIPATVEQLARHCSDFWASEELASTARSGAIFLIEPEAWAAELARWLEEERSTRSMALYRALGDYIEGGGCWRQLCLRLLPVLPESNRLEVAVQVLDGSSTSAESSPGASSPGTLLAFSGAQWNSYDELLVMSAMLCSGPQLLRMLREEESTVQQWGEHVSQIFKLATHQAHWGLRRQFARDKEMNALPELLAVHSFLAFTALRQAAATGQSALHTLLVNSGFPAEVVSDDRADKKRKGEKMSRKEKKREKKKKKRRKKDWLSESSDNEGGSSAEGEGIGPSSLGDARAIWRVDGRDMERPSSTLELLDEVMQRTMAAYVQWQRKEVQPASS